MYIEEQKLKDFIIDSGLISRDNLERAETQTKDKKTSLSDYLVTEGLLSEDEIKKVQAYILGIPFIDVGVEKIPDEVLSVIPEPIARKHNIISYKKEDGILEVAMLDTDDLGSIDFLRKKNWVKNRTSIDFFKFS